MSFFEELDEAHVVLILGHTFYDVSVTINIEREGAIMSSYHKRRRKEKGPTKAMAIVKAFGLVKPEKVISITSAIDKVLDK